jgi:hypothetical protein
MHTAGLCPGNPISLRMRGIPLRYWSGDWRAVLASRSQRRRTAVNPVGQYDAQPNESQLSITEDTVDARSADPEPPGDDAGSKTLRL